MSRDNSVSLLISTPSSAFVGRQEELAQIGVLFADPACRLLTLVGPGGIGKTRLALEAARQLAPDAYYVVPLQPLTSPDFIVATLADAVGYQVYGSENLKPLLLAYLHEKSWLLVLDNFEHLLDGAALLSEILAAAPAVRLLVTSRERLNLVEEWALDVGGLAFPPDANAVEGGHYSAVELFVQHARRVNASFRWSEAQQVAVGRICRLVDGMPLAIELSANWVRVLSCGAIADEIEHSLDILETPARNVEPRHRTMRAAIEPTWGRLSAAERDAFMRLSVFRGGFTREAAEQVAGASLRTLTALADKSLVRVDENGRCDLHELLRQYAAEKLLDAGEVDSTSERHFQYFLRLAENAEAHEFGSGQIVWFDRLEIEWDNLRVALAWSLKRESGLRLAASLGWFFSERTYFNEGLDWLEPALEANPDAPIALRAKASHSAGALAGMIGDKRLKAYVEQGLALAREAEDDWNIAWALSQIGFHYYENHNQSIAALDESIALFRRLEDPMGLSHTLVRRAWRVVDDQHDFDFGRLLLEEAGRIADEAGDRVISAWVSYNLGRIFWMQDRDYLQARRCFERSLALFREARFQSGTNLRQLAAVEQALGNLDRAQEYYTEAVVFDGERGGSHPVGLAGLASIARARGKFVHSATLLGTIDPIVMPYMAKHYPEIITYDSDMAFVREQLGEEAFAEAFAAGHAMTSAQAVAYVLEGSRALEMPANADQPESPSVGNGTPPAPGISLSRRELEILRLIADGYSNAEIADRLVLATSTVKWYVSQTFSKLEVTSRTQAVARARVLGLLN